MKLRRLPERYSATIMSLVLSLFMTAVVSFIATVNTAGLTQSSVVLWPATWMASWLIAFPTLLIVQPIVHRVVAVLIEPAGSR